MNTSRAVAVDEAGVAWGLALLTDPKSREQLPDRTGDNGVAACRSAVAVGIRHAVEGEARAEVWLGDVPGDLVCIHDDAFAADSGEVALSDAGNEQVVTASVGAGTRRLRVLVDDVAFPGRVVFELASRLGSPDARDLRPAATRRGGWAVHPLADPCPSGDTEGPGRPAHGLDPGAMTGGGA